MTPLALDPSEMRTPPERETRSWRMASLQAVLGLGMFAGCAYGVYVFSRGETERLSDVRFVKVGDWPEIRDGVPEKAAPKMAATSPTAPVPAPVSLASPMTAAIAPAEALPIPIRPMLPAQIAARVSEPAATAATPAPVPAPRPPVADVTADADRRAATTASTAPAAPLPPRKPAQTSDESRPKRVAAAAPPQRAPLQITRDRAPESPAGAAMPAPKTAEIEPSDDSDHVSVLGLKVPTLASTGRKILKTVDEFGDAVRSLPGKL